jgi:hypothetical protein
MQIKRLIETKFCPFQVLFLPIPAFRPKTFRLKTFRLKT